MSPAIYHMIAGGAAMLMIAAVIGIAAARRPASAAAWFAAFICASAIACAGAGADDGAVLLCGALSLVVFASSLAKARASEHRGAPLPGWRVALGLALAAPLGASVALLLPYAPALGDAAGGLNGYVGRVMAERARYDAGFPDAAAAARAAFRGLDLILLAGLFVVLAGVGLGVGRHDPAREEGR